MTKHSWLAEQFIDDTMGVHLLMKELPHLIDRVINDRMILDQSMTESKASKTTTTYFPNST